MNLKTARESVLLKLRRSIDATWWCLKEAPKAFLVAVMGILLVTAIVMIRTNGPQPAWHFYYR